MCELYGLGQKFLSPTLYNNYRIKFGAAMTLNFVL